MDVDSLSGKSTSDIFYRVFDDGNQVIKSTINLKYLSIILIFFTLLLLFTSKQNMSVAKYFWNRNSITLTHSRSYHVIAAVSDNPKSSVLLQNKEIERDFKFQEKCLLISNWNHEEKLQERLQVQKTDWIRHKSEMAYFSLRNWIKLANRLLFNCLLCFKCLIINCSFQPTKNRCNFDFLPVKTLKTTKKRGSRCYVVEQLTRAYTITKKK